MFRPASDVAVLREALTDELIDNACYGFGYNEYLSAVQYDRAIVRKVFGVLIDILTERAAIQPAGEVTKLTTELAGLAMALDKEGYIANAKTVRKAIGALAAPISEDSGNIEARYDDYKKWSAHVGQEPMSLSNFKWCAENSGSAVTTPAAPSVTEGDALPPLPDTKYFYEYSEPDSLYSKIAAAYSADQMHAYVLADRAARIPLPYKVKGHVLAAVVNKLRDTAIQFHAAGQLRSRIQDAIAPLIGGIEGNYSSDAARTPASIGEDAEFKRIRDNLLFCVSNGARVRACQDLLECVDRIISRTQPAAVEPAESAARTPANEPKS